MYNIFMKEVFLNTIENKNTFSLYISLFNKTSKLESQLDKDIFGFNLNEIELLLYTLNAPHINTINSYMNLMRSYTDYAIEEGYRISNINLYRTIRYNEFEKFLAKYKLKYISSHEFEDILNQMENDNDYALYLAIFEGLNGEKFSEISNLTIYDLKMAKELEDGYKLKLKNNAKSLIMEREILISKKLYKALEKAYFQKEYYTQNGLGSKRTILDGDYIFRNIFVSGNESVKTDKQLIYRKLNILSNLTKQSVSNITTIINSGILYYLSCNVEDGVICMTDIKDAMNRFGKAINKKQPNQSYKKFVKDYCDPLEEIYNIRINCERT